MREACRYSFVNSEEVQVMATPEELMWQDLVTKYSDMALDPTFSRLYETPEPMNKMFADFHQRLNAQFEFMNYKMRANGHFNAENSRQLITLIDDIRDAQQLLKRMGMEFMVADYYQKILDECKKFLVESGGSRIPDDFERINLVKYEPVFHLPDTQIKLQNRRERIDLKMIGSGAYANVYYYIDPDYEIPIALKRAKRNLTPRDLERFHNEFKLLKSLSFPYVLQVYQYNEARNEYTMEYCDATLREFIDKNNTKLSFGTRKRIALQFLYGLNYLHSKKHLHRDVSYQNVLVKKYDGAAVVVKISDFGLFKQHNSDLTRSESELRGTILDPTIKSFKEYSVANEIYAIGFVLSFIFSGRLDIVACTGAVRAIIDKCVAYQHAGRYGDVLSIIRDVESLEPETSKAILETPA